MDGFMLKWTISWYSSRSWSDRCEYAEDEVEVGSTSVFGLVEKSLTLFNI